MSFRSYGSGPQRIEFTGPLAVVHADNSQGKTGLAEALEFLFTGTTSRRTLTGGSLSEFESSLRNVHLPEGCPVYVEVGLESGDSHVRKLRRELTSDYVGATDCTSVLSLDGQVIETVATAGIPLSSPPLAAPVLLEHTLRYSVSAKPGERSGYFKAILEVSDLELVRKEVASLIAERSQEPLPSLLTTLKELSGEVNFGALLTPISAAGAHTAVEAALTRACQAVVPPGNPDDTFRESLAAALQRLNEHIAIVQRSTLPLSELLTASLAETPPVLELDVTARVKPYSDKLATVDGLTSALVPILRAALNVEAVTDVDATHPIDCPLCQTVGAITEVRLRGIREQVADQEQLTAVAVALRDDLRLQASRLSIYGDLLETEAPIAADWSEEDRARYLVVASELGDADGNLARALVAVDDAARTLALMSDEVRAASQAVMLLAEHVDSLKTLTEGDLGKATSALSSSRLLAAELTQARAVLEAARTAVVDAIGHQAEVSSGTATWVKLADLAARSAEVFELVAADASRGRADGLLKRAARELDQACQKVLDDRLLAMSETVGRWWNLLRPGESTSFEALARRGTGQQYLDLTATLRSGDEQPGTVRNALAILSNSQLNALGLAAFLARAQLLGSKIVVLDDPVQGTDPEHRFTFANGVVAQLLADGSQVLVTTFDSQLARLLQSLHQHLQIDEFKATLVDSRVGTEIIRSGDDFERLMLDASSQMPSPLEANRRSAGNSLRIAAERLAKQVIIAGRKREGLTAQLSDFDNKNLRDLRPMAIGYALDPREPGQWQALARLLNDADHDTLDPPRSTELKSCFDTLRDIKRRHVEHDRDLMTS